MAGDAGPVVVAADVAKAQVGARVDRCEVAAGRGADAALAAALAAVGRRVEDLRTTAPSHQAAHCALARSREGRAHYSSATGRGPACARSASRAGTACGKA
jgi:hypothetical protein